MQYKIITEGSAKIKISTESKISKQLPVFYNPIMKFNRDVSVLLLNNIDKKNMQMADILAGSGVRAIRLSKELKKGKIKRIYANDLDKNSVKIIKENIKLNKAKNIIVSNKDANLFLLESTGFDYIDIDPFGTPNPFLNSAVLRLARNGILAATATDTSSLAGTYPDACMRKYWALPINNELMHELGVRILIRKVQLIASQYEKALLPVFSYSREHYYRVFFSCEKGKKKVDEILSQHGMLDNSGPMWLGKLWDAKLAHKMCRNSDDFVLKTIKEECKINAVGFYDIHKICSSEKMNAPNMEKLLKEINKTYPASRTHFNLNAVKSAIPKKELIEIIRECELNLGID